MRHTLAISGILLSMMLVTATASAQDAGGSGAPASSARRSSVQLAFQGRVNAMGYVVPTELLAQVQTITPYVTPGVRLIDGKLFVGIGIGFGSYSTEVCQDTCADYDRLSQSYFTLSPMATFDLLQAGPASLYVGGWFSFAPVSTVTFETRRGGSTLTEERNGGSALGFNLAVGIRAEIVRGLAVGTEWGWGLASYADDGREVDVPADDISTTTHGLFGTVMVEGAIDL
jgi:hypothetical protein